MLSFVHTTDIAVDELVQSIQDIEDSVTRHDVAERVAELLVELDGTDPIEFIYRCGVT